MSDKNKNKKQKIYIRMNKNNDKLKDYLLCGNDKLIGSVIGFRKRLILKNFEKWKNDKSDVKYLPEGYAILLYFDHRTGKIERHLYNPNLIFFRRKPLVNDYTTNIIQSRSTKYINPYVFNNNSDRLFTKILQNFILYGYDPYDQDKFKEYHSEISKYRDRPLIEIDNKEFLLNPELENDSNLSFKNLFDGKLTRYMYNLFILELTRDYMKNLNSNIENIDLMTINLSLKETTTDMLKIRENKDQIIKWTILNYPSNEVMKEINIPKHLFSIQVNEMFIKYFNIKLIPILINDSPPVIKDLKSMINSQTVLNNIKLQNLINKFNRINIDRCINL